MKKLLYAITLLLSLGLACAQAEAATDTDISRVNNTIYVESVEANSGDVVTLSVQMKNITIVTGYQVDIVLPEGLSFVTTDGYAEASLSAERLASTRSHTFDAEFQEDGSLRLLCYSSKNVTFSGNTGEVATVQIKVAGNASGQKSVQLTGIVLTDSQGKTVEAADVYFSVNVTGGGNYNSKYDINEDGKVDVQDVTMLVDYILEK